MSSRRTEDPRGFLAELTPGGVIDEIQNVPELTSYVQDLVDDLPRRSRLNAT